MEGADPPSHCHSLPNWYPAHKHTQTQHRVVRPIAFKRILPLTECKGIKTGHTCQQEARKEVHDCRSSPGTSPLHPSAQLSIKGGTRKTATCT